MSIPSSRLLRRDEARNAPRLEVLLDDHALLARERAVVGARDLFLCELVEPDRQPLGEAAAVDEDDRRAVRLDELEHRGIDRGPDRAGLGRFAHVVERNDDLEVELLARARVDELDRAVAGDEAADLFERALRRGEADALRRLGEQGVEPFQGERHVRAALRPRDGVHLVHDHRLERAQRLARLRGQHQVERLRRRDQDVGRLLDELAPLLLGRVAGADADAELGLEAGERAAQVPLDVVVERLQRRDVEQAEPAAGVAIELVDPVEEGGERLAGAGRRLDQDVASGGNGGPALHLRRRRPGERALEPAPRLRRERRERIHAQRLAAATRASSRDREEQELGERSGREVVVADEEERAAAVGELLPERHPLDVVERDPERLQIEHERLLGRPNAPEQRREAVEAVDVRRRFRARPDRA